MEELTPFDLKLQSKLRLIFVLYGVTVIKIRLQRGSKGQHILKKVEKINEWFYKQIKYKL